MKKLLLILLCLPLIGCGDKRVLIDELTNKGSNDNPIMYYKSKLFSGIGFNVYKNQRIEREENYKNGKREGSWKRWYISGQLESEKNYKDGKKIKQIEWYENGQVEAEYTLIDGNRDRWNHTFYYDNGQIEYIEDLIKKDREVTREGVVRSWYYNGQLEYEHSYKNGEIIFEKCWDEDGNEIEC
jgi:antitoxin component YwqK of YwqJK toxin-antitoxin module